MWGIVGVQQEAAYAAERVIVTVEEVVDDHIVRADPNRTVLPAHTVDAVVHCPGGAHPSYAQGYYVRDNDFYREWTPISRDPKRLASWIRRWVQEVADRPDYLALLGAERWGKLQADRQAPERMPLPPIAPFGESEDS